MPPQRRIQIEANDGERFEVDRDVIGPSTTLSNMFKDLGIDEKDEGDGEGTGAAASVSKPSAEPILIQLPQNSPVTGELLEKIVKWCEHHHNDLIDEDAAEIDGPIELSAWDKEFVNVDQGTLINLTLTASFLDIPGLIDVCCQAFANIIRGKSTEEIRQMFDIEKDFTPEEEEKIRRENAWIEG